MFFEEKSSFEKLIDEFKEFASDAPGALMIVLLVVVFLAVLLVVI